MSPSLGQRIASDASFERLYRLHRRDVYGAVLRDVRDPAEAEDVTQIAFLNAFRAMRRGERPAKPRAWLVTIARNVIRRRYREVTRRPQEVGLDPETAASLMEVDGPTADEISGAIRRLPRSQRTVILLREIQGRSYAEIAEEMGLSLAAVETLIFRARRSLSEELELADRVPTTQRRRRGLFVLPLPGLSKLSFGFSLSRAGVAAFVGSVAIVTVPVDSSADPVHAPPVERGPSALGSPAAAPTSLAPLIRTVDETKEKQRRGDGPRAQEGTGGKQSPDTESDGGAGTLPAVEVPGLPAVEVSDLPVVENVSLPPLPVETEPLPVEPPPLEVPTLPELPELPPPPLP